MRTQQGKSPKSTQGGKSSSSMPDSESLQKAQDRHEKENPDLEDVMDRLISDMIAGKLKTSDKPIVG